MTRVLDIFLSLFAILLFSPVLIPVMILLRFTGEGEIFFVQKRIGKGGKVFGLIKFATMLKNSPNIGTGTLTVKDDPRVLPYGRFLRKSKLNELPQLFNILFGHMSVIGPRPLTDETFAAYSDDVQREIGKVRPGLSGIGSIVFRNEENILQSADDASAVYRTVIAPYKGALEIWFVAHVSVGLYLKCIWLTLVIIATSKMGTIWRSLPDLPAPPQALRQHLSYSSDTHGSDA